MRLSMVGIVILVAAALTSGTDTHAFDASSCQDGLDRLKRASRDADDAGSSLSDQDDRDDAIDSVNSALDEVESRLRRAKSACEGTPPLVRACIAYRSIARLSGAQAARNQCVQGLEKQSPGFCAACLGK